MVDAAGKRLEGVWGDRLCLQCVQQVVQPELTRLSRQLVPRHPVMELINVGGDVGAELALVAKPIGILRVRQLADERLDLVPRGHHSRVPGQIRFDRLARLRLHGTRDQLLRHAGRCLSRHESARLIDCLVHLIPAYLPIYLQKPRDVGRQRRH